MDQDIIKNIIMGKIPCYFISSHLDDAALSCGGLLSYLSAKTRVCVVTVFTEASPKPYTLSAKAFLSQVNYEEANHLFRERREEDRVMLESLGIETVHFHFQDALWRKKFHLGWFRQRLAYFIPEFGHIYPTYRFHVISGHISNGDASLLKSIKKKLVSLFRDKERFLVFCPLAIGNHIDHVIVRDLSFELFEHVIFWSDFPYNLKRETEANWFIEKNKLRSFIWKTSLAKKIKLISFYKTQVKSMFPKGIPIIPENYYMSQSVVNNLLEGNRVSNGNSVSKPFNNSNTFKNKIL